MQHASRVLLTLVVSLGIGVGCLQAQTPKTSKKAAAPGTTVRPKQVEIVALQVTKLPRNQFGQGIKPGTNETVAFWLANSGTAVDLRIKMDRPIVQFDEKASRLIRFADDKDGVLTRPPDGKEINSFFPDNKPIIVNLGPKPDEAEVILRGFGTPASGATKFQVHADLVFVAGSGERTAEAKDLEPKPGSEATVGPLHLTFKEPRKGGGPLNPLFSSERGGAPSMNVEFEYERSEKSIKSLTCLNAKGEPVVTLEGTSFAGASGGATIFGIPRMARLHMRVVYFEKTDNITVPIRLETGVGF
jgi:hypothetical protein